MQHLTTHVGGEFSFVREEIKTKVANVRQNANDAIQIFIDEPKCINNEKDKKDDVSKKRLVQNLSITQHPLVASSIPLPVGKPAESPGSKSCVMVDVTREEDCRIE